MINVYGIKNCSTVRKALNWLEDNGIEYKFHDYKKEGVSSDKIGEWQKQVDWQSLINKKGTTWRKLEKEIQESIKNENSAVQLMQDNTSLIKRPIIEGPDSFLLGFDEGEYSAKLLS